ncbi:hypothetical protein V502_01634 [Pseudogymnoascus sp. VKM F-4520 (FW-2644)]|nr:hypothetical protein V502_01634 [Pseudogymnoascus sp. VKM F-4520 (FW-2644)]
MSTSSSSQSSKTAVSTPRAHHRSSPSLTPELAYKVAGWLETQPPVSPYQPIGVDRRGENASSSTSSSSGKKSVHWTPDVVDNEKKPRRRRSTKRSSEKSSSSKSRVRPSVPMAPEPPRAHAPPPTPRFHRLPTPDSSDVECEEFCYCCREIVGMAAAKSHIVSVKQKTRSRH